MAAKHKVNIMQKVLGSLCKLISHQWCYNDYSNWIKENGDCYDFTASRKCLRCNEHHYFYKTWKAESKIGRYDIKTHALSLRQFEQLQAQKINDGTFLKHHAIA